jgi:uncharacterized protein DUF6998
MDWKARTDAELLADYASLMDEMRARSMVRSSNNPVGDLAEGLVARALGLKLDGNSTAGYDATGPDGKRYQIKGRRLTQQNPSTQLSALRNLKDEPFDFLAAVMFNADFSIAYAAVIPLAVVVEHSRPHAHTNSDRFLFRRGLLDDPRVTDITDKLRAVAQEKALRA